MFAGICLRGDFVYLVTDLEGLQDSDLRSDIEIAAQSAELEIEVNQRYPMCAVDDQAMRKIRCQEACTGAAFAVHDGNQFC